ncbi:MAG: hypothetical protein GYB53_14895 [Rhodobacteraceae bacterium]|nr:hypothetical protein [Paracoccaceae bacterium]MBR9823642.1 hypothetical protein [Paracoccaceae bacterium]
MPEGALSPSLLAPAPATPIGWRHGKDPHDRSPQLHRRADHRRLSRLCRLPEPKLIAAGLAFDCTPVGNLFGLPGNGRRVQFTENVFYHYAPGPAGTPRIRDVWSVIDQAAIAAQLRST